MVYVNMPLLQIELNILSIKEYTLLQWLVKQEERLTVHIEILIRTELEEIRAFYFSYKVRCLDVNIARYL